MFTRDQIEEIKKKLIMLGTKDTQFPDAHKLNGEEIIAIVQDGENRKIPLSSIIGLLSDINVTPNDDFINVSKDTTGILTLDTAVSKVVINNRKLGQIITFKDSANSWAICQFTGSSLDNWGDTSLWKSISGIDELKSQVETNAEDISALSDEIERHDASILNLNTDVSKLKDKDIETSSSLSELNTKVDTLKSQADTNTSNISNLNTEVSTLHSKVDEHTTSISQINNTITGHEESIAQINTKLSEHTTSISENKIAIEKNTSDIKNVSDIVDAQAARLDDVDTTLENALFKNKGYFTTLEKLNEAIPNPTIGSKAYVGTSEPYAIYIVENGVWVDSGYTGGDEIVAKITTDRIEDGAVTTGKLEPSIQSLITNISKNASFAGIATPTTNPGIPDGPVFYIAAQTGTYSNFNNLTVSEGELAFFLYDTMWQKESMQVQDNISIIPTRDSGSEIALINVNGHEYRLYTFPPEFKQVKENGFFLADASNNVALKYDSNGFDVAKLSRHFKELVGDTIPVFDRGFFLADDNNNIGLKYDKDGFDVAKVSNHFKSLIGGGKDWSNSYTIEIPIPKVPAIVNLTCDHLPVSPNKDDNLTGSIEFYDMNGNVFRKDISSLNKQGRSSMAFPKPNLSFDIDDGTPIKFGDWVYQDSFHLKAQYIDVFRGGRGIVSYHIQEEIQNHNPWYAARPWRKIVSDDVTINAGTGVKGEDLYCNAKGIPDGFPIKLYVNGKFYGLYTWNLKKHRDNMAMKKDNSKHIHIDGESYNTALFNGAANIDWTKFEIRNPKYLVYAHSTSSVAFDREYDADIRQAEIAGESPSITATAFSSTTTYAKDALVTLEGRMYLSLINGNVGHIPTPCAKPKNVFKNATEWIDVTFTNEVKQHIIRLSGSNSVSTKEAFSEYFDADWSIDYLLQINAFVNCDVLTNNTQFCTWDGSIWFPMAYDQDQCYGLWWDGTYIRTGSLSPSNVILGSTYQTGTPLSKIFTLFKSEMDARYKDLFDSDILSTNHIMDSLIKWVDELGDDNIAKELSIWNETPSYRESGTYKNAPTTGGFYDSIARVAKYMTVREIKMKQFFNY